MAALRMVLHLRSTSINRRTSIILCRRLPSTFCNSASDNESLPHWARLTLALYTRHHRHQHSRKHRRWLRRRQPW